MSANSANAVIDISLDFSKAEVLVGKTLDKTLTIEDKIRSIEDAIVTTTDGLNLNQEILERADARITDQTTVLEEHRIMAEETRNFQRRTAMGIVSNQAANEETSRETERISNTITAQNNRALANFRRTAAFGTYIFQAIGVGIGQSLTLLAETVSLTVETARLLQQQSIFEATRSLLTGDLRAGIFLAGIAVRGVLIASLLYLNVQILNKKNQFNAEFQNIVGAMRIITI